MFVKICGCRLFALLFAASMSLLHSGPVDAQDRVPPDSRALAEQVPPSDLKAFAEAIRVLQTQVQSLTSEVSELRGSQQRASAETALLRSELESAKAELASRTASPAPSGTLVPEVPALAQTGQPDVEQRVAKLEDAQQLTDARIAEHYQTKVESGSKYRVRLSGIVLLNLFHTQGIVDNLDFPQVAVPPSDALESSRAFGGTLRQSQIELSAFGPDIAGAHTSANIKFDFAGGLPNTPNGITMGVARLRTGTIRLDWAKTSIVAGQDSLFFAPLIPTSLASLAIPPLSYAGRLWSWAPQIRVEHQIDLSDSTNLLLQGGILNSLTGDLPLTQPLQPGYRYPTAGEQSGQPAYASRIALRHRAFGKDFALGVGGYYARQNWGFRRNVDSWAVTTDLSLPITNWMAFSGEFYRGRALGGLGGGIGQTILVSGALTDSSTVVRGLDSMGGWVQLKLKPKSNFEVNAAVGQDNPYSSELRRFANTPQWYGVFQQLQSRNLSPFVNFIYQVRSDVLFSLEYRRLQSYPLDAKPNKANQISLSMGYLF
jgi:hypothetical protein